MVVSQRFSHQLERKSLEDFKKGLLILFPIGLIGAFKALF